MRDDISPKEMDWRNEMADLDTRNALKEAREKNPVKIAKRFNTDFPKTYWHTTTEGAPILVKVTKVAWVEGDQAYFRGRDLGGDGEPKKFEIHLNDQNGIRVKFAAP